VSTDHYEVVIVGSGAGGGTLAHRLAGAGRRVLLLERGDYLPREKQNWDVVEVFDRDRYISRDTWHDRAGKAFPPEVHYFVGGATKMYGAALYRLRAEDFGEVRHHDGVSPAWPISYTDMEPYYTQAERLYHVHGEHGVDPTDPPATAQYAFPPVSHEPRIQEMSDQLAKAGHHPFHAPVGVLLDEGDRAASKCLRCDTCDGFPCLVHAKADAETICVRPALRDGNLTMVRNAEVRRLETSPDGRQVTGVVVSRDGELEHYAGDLVVLSAGASNSAIILLASAGDRHPGGLANGSGMVGRNYLFHNSQGLIALSREPNSTRFQKTLGLNDFYFAGDGEDFPLGNIQMIGKSSGPMYREDARARYAPEFGLDFVARHAVDFWLTTEDLPRPENRIRLTGDGQVVLDYTPNNLEPAKRLRGKLESMLGMLGMHRHLIPNTVYFRKTIGLASVGHQAGTVRFGTDPRTSVLDPDCKAHELDNLYVVDTSFFPSIGAVNPSLTAIANALRVGDHIDRRLAA
jgi:choline dehydrogenase-like flavoprotein